MASAPSEPTAAGRRSGPVPVKIVVAGGFGVGKTTFVGSISEIAPLTTEAAMTTESLGVDDTAKVATKTMTTVAMDFGRITLGDDLLLYLFGTPGQERFRFMWDELTKGAIGAVVLIDTRRLEECFPAVDYFETHRVPFVVGINCFDGEAVHSIDDVREALAVPQGVPMLYCDARQRSSTKHALVCLVQHAMQMARAGVATR